MKLHWLQHVPFEGPGMIAAWARARGVGTRAGRLFANDPLPELAAFDLLVVMGGPMGIYDHDEYPWLVAEKVFIRKAIDGGKAVLGICLGAQLIADVLGAQVRPNPCKEIGWFPVVRDPDAPSILPPEITVLHWHGDTFGIPPGAVRLASSAACENQGFMYGDRVVGLQFHLETTPRSLEALIQNCAHELVGGPFIQTAGQLRAGLANTAAINACMEHLLDTLAGHAR